MPSLEQFWSLIAAQDKDGFLSLFSQNGDASLNDALFCKSNGIDGIAAHSEYLFKFWRDRVKPGQPAAVWRSRKDGTRHVVETTLTIKDGSVWNPEKNEPEVVPFTPAHVAIVGKYNSEGKYTEVATYMGTWGVLNGKPKVRLGPVPVSDVDSVALAFKKMPIATQYFDILRKGEIKPLLDLFEMDGYFRDPSDSYMIGRNMLGHHFSMLIGQGHPGLCYHTATCTDDFLGIEYDFEKLGRKRIEPQAGFIAFQLGENGKIGAVRVYGKLLINFRFSCPTRRP